MTSNKLTRILVVALMEIRSYLRDKADLAFSMLLPIAIFALMYGAFGGQNQFNGTVHLVNSDTEGIYSAQLIEQLENISSLTIDQLSSSDADAKLRNSDLLMVISVPPDFSSKLASGQNTELLFRQRGNGGQEGQIAASIVRGVADNINRELNIQNQLKNNLIETNIPQEQIQITVQSLIEQEQTDPSVSIINKTIGEDLNPVTTFLPGIMTMFILFAASLTAQALVAERKKRTLERLLTTQLSIGQLFTGKFLANTSRGMIQTFILLTLAQIVFRIFTPLIFLQSLVIALVFTAAVSTIGLIIGSIAHTEDQASWIAVFFTMFMSIIGGTFFEIPQNSILETVSKVSINTYANDAFQTIIMRSGSLKDISFELLVMASIIVVGMILSHILFQKSLKGKQE